MVNEVALFKYPVYSNRRGVEREYRVDVGVEHEYSFGGLDRLYVRVFTRQRSRLPWREFKWVKVYGRSCNTLHHQEEFDEWNGRYVELAKDAVYEYESEILSDAESQRRREQGVVEFEQWDGRCE